ncbi:hypothetical protein N4T57_07380 [Campylobacter hepaticus]|uniref:Uncharacterized protein n=2 Tax=Campylobacter hepaticus TaxID=1813019 RepID=A0A424Z1P7_9BACT|nr:hypothetical protein [Campylobacter hepaticus]AXP09320.1 hypothetical protein A2J15_006585 [Campylobacter hepaticus]MCZ0772935.1 hypothetical protein [Campylobacter hepaticus]MCZ0774404.1 hypothetical protein [Campylobacter hepaticus]MCZ0775656.1 hypothetical protein [Campylobacter hepaticus]MPV54311.1 hypothetical protein [Campylobacter hepaticus]
MAFMNFSGFFYARNDIKLFKIANKKVLKTFFYNNYILVNFKDELNLNNKSFFYNSQKANLFKENDEILISYLNKKIILFKNFTQNTDNFKEAKSKQGWLLFFLFLSNIFFINLAIINEFNTVDLLFLMIGFLLLTMGFINLILLFKQINILKNSSKKEIKEFLKQRKNT